MSAAMQYQFDRSVSMSTSGSSVASGTPDSEHTISVLGFSQRYGTSSQPQSAPSSCKRKRCQDVEYRDDHQQPFCQQRECDPIQCKTGKQSKKHLLSGTQPSAVNPAAGSSENATYYTAVYNCLVQWCCRLKALQPKCIITTDVLHRTLDLFHRFRLALQFRDRTHPAAERAAVTAAHLAGCLWIAAKNDGNRSCVPSRTLLTKAIAVQPDDLSKAELTVCCKLNWNIFNTEVAFACLPGSSAFN